MVTSVTTVLLAEARTASDHRRPKTSKSALADGGLLANGSGRDGPVVRATPRPAHDGRISAVEPITEVPIVVDASARSPSRRDGRWCPRSRPTTASTPNSAPAPSRCSSAALKHNVVLRRRSRVPASTLGCRAGSVGLSSCLCEELGYRAIRPGNVIANALSARFHPWVPVPRSPPRWLPMLRTAR